MSTENNETSFEKILQNETFISLKTNRERIEYILTSFKILPLFRDEVFEKMHKYCDEHQKSLFRSKSMRNEALIYFKRKDFNIALNYFTKAILNAPFPSEDMLTNNELFLAYSSRSITLFKLEKYETALFDANHAIRLFPNFKMLFHKVMCLTKLKKYIQSKVLLNHIIIKVKKQELELKSITFDQLLKLRKFITNEIQDCDEKLNEFKESEDMLNAWTHPSIDMISSQEKGRHFISKNFIPKGTLVLVEKPFKVVMFEQNILNHCLNCHKFIEDQIWPCIGCNEVVFCDEKCAEEATNQFHRYECGFVGLLYELGSDALLTYRIFAEYGYQIIKYCETNSFKENFDLNHSLNNDRLKTVQSSDKSFTDKITELRSFLALMDHNISYDINSDVYQALVAIELVILLHYNNALNFNIVEDMNLFLEVTNIFIINIRRLSVNMFGYSEADEHNDSIHVSNVVYNRSSFFNHNCNPNLKWTFHDLYIKFETKNNINIGQELAISYGPDSEMTFKERQTLLLENYFFTCVCDSCLSDAQSVSALQCHQCDGPVIYESNTEMASCLKCKHNFENIVECIEKVESNRIILSEMIENIKNSKNMNYSSKAENSFKLVFSLVYRKNNQLLSETELICEQLFKFDIKRAVNYFNEYIKLINERMNASNLGREFNSLASISKILYEYLIVQKCTDSEEWGEYFQINKKLVDLIIDIKNITENSLNKRKETINLLKNAIEMKSSENKVLEKMSVS